MDDVILQDYRKVKRCVAATLRGRRGVLLCSLSHLRGGARGIPLPHGSLRCALLRSKKDLAHHHAGITRCETVSAGWRGCACLRSIKGAKRAASKEVPRGGLR